MNNEELTPPPVEFWQAVVEAQQKQISDLSLRLAEARANVALMAARLDALSNLNKETAP